MAKYGVKPRILAEHEKPNYGGSIKPTTPDIKKVTGAGPQDKYSLQRDNARAEAKFNRGAAKPWHSKGKPAKSIGSCDVAGDKPSTKVGVGPGYDDRKGYKKVR